MFNNKTYVLFDMLPPLLHKIMLIQRKRLMIRFMQVLSNHFLIGHLYLIGERLGEDQGTNTKKTHVYKRLDYVFRLN